MLICLIAYLDNYLIIIVSLGFFLSLGILEESLQQYGSLIPIHVDDVVEKLQDIFSESFSQPHRSDTVNAFTCIFTCQVTAYIIYKKTICLKSVSHASIYV